MAPENAEGGSGTLTLASGGRGPSVGRRRCGAGLPRAGGRAGAGGGAGALAELLEAGPAAALLPAAGLRRDVAVAAVVAEHAAAHPGDRTSTGCEHGALSPGRHLPGTATGLCAGLWTPRGSRPPWPHPYLRAQREGV